MPAEVALEWRRGNLDDAGLATPDPSTPLPPSQPLTPDTADTVVGDYETDRITFSCDLSGPYNPFPIVEPVVRETKFC